MVNWQGRCNDVAWIYGQLVGGQSVIDPCYTVTPHKSICQQYRCAFSYMWNLFGVIVLYAAMVNWLGVHLLAVEMCILLYVKLIWCNGLPCTYGHLRGSIFHQYLCAFSNMWNWFGEMVLHAPMVDWLGVYLPLVYLCIVLCVKHMWCNDLACSYGWLPGGPSACGIYVHFPICETYEV